MTEKQVISRKRVEDHGEVYTRKREVDSMLDLVKQETERIESRFLEPACGTGNFLAEVLMRKLHVVESRYKRSQLEFERNAVLAVSSIYGIDILHDNVSECRERLFGLFDEVYTRLYKADAKNECRNAAEYILEQNIIHGDALTLKTVGENPQPIIFSEWSPVNGSMLKRRDFTFSELLNYGKERKQLTFLNESDKLTMFSDLGENVFIPEPVKEFPLIHFLKIVDVDRS